VNVSVEIESFPTHAYGGLQAHPYMTAITADGTYYANVAGFNSMDAISARD
jgi:hypothetical protein